MNERGNQMNAIVTQEQSAAIFQTLKNSLYPGASDTEVAMVLDYCTAAGLDPIQKPVHLVPMSVSTGAKDAKGFPVKAMRTVVMPGIGVYRTQAVRTGAYVGLSEAKFGPTTTLDYSSEQWVNGQKSYVTTTLKYPEWCSITVRRVVGTIVCEFTATEFWLENYARRSAGNIAPNAMWEKRPFGQLAKCAEAQALRKGFPEVGALPTFDEMEEHTEPAERTVTVDARPEALPTLPDDYFEKHGEKLQSLIDGGKDHDHIISVLSTKAKVTDEQKATIRAMKKAPSEPAAADSEAGAA